MVKKPEVTSEPKKKRSQKVKTDVTRKPYFHAAEGSDAESKSELNSFGVDRFVLILFVVFGTTERGCRLQRDGSATVASITRSITITWRCEKSREDCRR